jgi:predicted PurR-regulated permease PerM
MTENDRTEDGVYRERIAQWFLLALALAISVMFYRVVSPYLMALLMAAIFAGMSYPFYLKLCDQLRGRRRLSAALVLILVFFLVVVPTLLFVGVLANQALSVSQSVGPWIQEQIDNPGSLDRQIGARIRAIPVVGDFIPAREVILGKLGEAAGRVGGFLVSGLASAAQGTLSFLLKLFIMLYSMYFFLTGGPATLRKILYLIPLTSSQEERLVRRFVSVTRATIKGTLVIGLVQGGLAGVSFWLAGIHGPVFWGTIMVVLSIIPAVGASLVWIPAVIYLYAIGEPVSATAVLLWCGVVVSSSDNILRPILVGRDTQMPDVLVLLSTLGGIGMFGVLGFIVGPIIAALFLTVWDLYAEAFGRYLPEVEAPEG